MRHGVRLDPTQSKALLFFSLLVRQCLGGSDASEGECLAKELRLLIDQACDVGCGRRVEEWAGLDAARHLNVIPVGGTEGYGTRECRCRVNVG
jgi:hypothetical protein